MTDETKLDQNKESLILIVDDDNTLLKFFKIHLNKFFSKVVVVKNGREAVNAVKEREYDLILSDIRMPKMNGIDLLRKVKKLDCSIPVVMVSGALLDDEQESIVESEADGYLRKPFGVDQLHSVMVDNLDKREKLLNLKEVCRSQKSFKDLVAGKIPVQKAVVKANLPKAEEIYSSIYGDGELKSAS